MSKGRVVVIENDDWIARLLEEGLNDAGYEVILSSEALEGFQRAQEKLPDCIICDVALPDFDGYWVAHKVRADSSPISTTPFLFLTQADDEASPLEAFNVGADVQLTKPFRLDEVVAQVGALVEMAKRLRKTRDSFLDKRAQPPLGEALRGDLAQMSLATVLALLEMERRSGQLQVAEGDTADRKGTAKATIDLASGFATGGTLGGTSSGLLQILREIMKWKSGLLTFHVGPEAPPPNPKRPIGAILMEAVQLNATGSYSAAACSQDGRGSRGDAEEQFGLTEVPIGRAERALALARGGIAAPKGPGQSFRSAYEGVPIAHQGVDPAHEVVDFAYQGDGLAESVLPRRRSSHLRSKQKLLRVRKSSRLLESAHVFPDSHRGPHRSVSRRARSWIERRSVVRCARRRPDGVHARSRAQARREPDARRRQHRQGARSRGDHLLQARPRQHHPHARLLRARQAARSGPRARRWG